MKGKIIGFILCCMLILMPIMTGCSLVETNYGKYNNQIVATIENKESKNKIEITKKELLQSYQSYGYNYVQYQGMSQSEALKKTLELLENRKITLVDAEKKFEIGEDGEGLSEKEQTYLYQKTIEALNENLDSYYSEIVPSKEETKEDEGVKFEGYTKSVILRENDGVYTIEKIETSNDLMEGFSYTKARNFFNSNDYKLIYENLIGSLEDNNYKKAFDKYYRDLKLSEYGMKLSTDAKSVFEREINRLYKVVYENYILNKYTDSIKNSTNISSVTSSQIVNLYTSKARDSYTQYVIEQDSAYESNVQQNLNDVYYFKNDSSSTKFFTVANVLFKFNDEQQSLYNQYKKRYESQEGGYSYVQYQQDLNDLYAQITPKVRDYDAETDSYQEIESDLTTSQVLAEIQSQMNDLKSEENKNSIGNKINEFIYKYNEDPGMFNATNNYVIGVDENGNAVSSFVESFNDAGLELYNGGKGKVGDTSGLVRSEYGLHILIYTGKCENLFDGVDSSFELDDNAIEVLYTTRINPLVDKTYFDMLYDEIYTDNYSYYENVNIKFLRQEYKIYEYSKRIEDIKN